VTGQLAQNWATGRPLTDDLAKATIEGAAVQGGMHLGMGTLPESMHAAVAEVADSQLRVRSQQKFEEAMNQIFEGDQSLRIPAQDFVNYFVGKDIDPSVMASRVGVQNLTEAAAAGADLEIPKANYFGKLEPEHQKGLLADLIDPSTEMTARQAEAGRQELATGSRAAAPRGCRQTSPRPMPRRRQRRNGRRYTGPQAALRRRRRA
jgi:hypothetical protein